MTKIAQVDESRLNRKMKRVERGMDYDSYSKDTFIHQEQTILFRRWLEEVAINEECITFQHTITITNSLVVKRRTDILTTHSISDTTMRA